MAALGQPALDIENLAVALRVPVPRVGLVRVPDGHRGSHLSQRVADLEEAVQHSVAQYVNGQAHVNGVESFWASLKRGYHGTHHWMSAKHLDRYVAEFCGRHNRRPLDTEDMMAASVRGMVGRQLTYGLGLAWRRPSSTSCARATPSWWG